MSKELLFYCNIPILYSNDPIFNQVPGFNNYRTFAHYFDVNVSLCDRSNVIKFPFKMKSSPMPVFDKDFNLSYKECALSRMAELDTLHKQTGKKFRLLYSGGVDSSAIFSSFIEYYGLDKTKDILEICCSKESIDENPWLWDRYIRKANFDIVSAHDHGYQWSDDKIIIMGEGNDQLFGKRSDYAYYASNPIGSKEITLQDVKHYLKYKSSNINGDGVAHIFFNLLKSAPFPITNMFTFLWWINFVLTWDGVLNRVISQSTLNKLQDNKLVQFYNTIEFQQWSMNYHYRYDITLAPLYKHECKELTIDILNIPEYKNKHKFLSFPKLHAVRPTAFLIDEDLYLYRNTSAYLKFVQPNNSFI